MGETEKKTAFYPGQLVYHRLFKYRGVVVDVDPVFSLSHEWYEQMAKSRPPKDRPWYRVLVHNAVHQTYVAERNLEEDHSSEAINHPELFDYFEAFMDGKYLSKKRSN